MAGLRLVVHEHQALHLRCPSCQAVSVGTFPVKAPSRAQYGPRLRALAVYLVEAQLVPFGRAQQLLADPLGVPFVRFLTCSSGRAVHGSPWRSRHAALWR